jgi:hypothetical protein
VPLPAEQIVVDVAGGASNRMLRGAMCVGAIVAGVLLMMLMHARPAHADEPTPTPPTVGGSLVEAVLPSVLAPASTAIEITTDPMPETVQPPVQPSVVPTVVPVVSLLPVLAATAVEPLIETVRTAPVGLIDAALDQPIGSVTEPVSDAATRTLHVENVADSFGAPTTAMTDSVPALQSPVLQTLPALATNGLLHVATSGHSRTPAPTPSNHRSPVVPSPLSPAPLAGDAQRAAGHDVLHILLPPVPDTGGTPWWLFIAAAFGWRSALVVSRLERPG